MFFAKKEEPIGNVIISITIGSVVPPTVEEYKQLRSDQYMHSIILKIIDYRIANTYKSIGEGKLSNEDLQSLNGTLRGLTDLRAILK